MEPYPSYMFYFIENLWEFMGYWTSSYYGQWISLSNWKLGVWTSPWMQSVLNEPCKETGFNSMDQKSWKAVAWKASETNSTKTMIFEKNRMVRRVCPGGFPRKYVPNVNSCPHTWYWSVSRKLSFLEMKVTSVNWKRLFGPKFPNPELIRLPWMSKPWF